MTKIMSRAPLKLANEDILRYVLYDIRENPSISKIHLPTPTEDGPVLLLIDKKHYTNIYIELNEMNENEGFQWMTCLIMRPMGAHSPPDLIEDAPYILIAHMDLVKDDLDGFFDRMATMRKWIVN